MICDLNTSKAHMYSLIAILNIIAHTRRKRDDIQEERETRVFVSRLWEVFWKDEGRADTGRGWLLVRKCWVCVLRVLEKAKAMSRVKTYTVI